jgi:hypothetical protein
MVSGHSGGIVDGKEGLTIYEYMIILNVFIIGGNSWD